MVGRGCCDWRPLTERRRARPGRQPLSVAARSAASSGSGSGSGSGSLGLGLGLRLSLARSGSELAHRCRRCPLLMAAERRSLLQEQLRRACFFGSCLCSCSCSCSGHAHTLCVSRMCFSTSAHTVSLCQGGLAPLSPNAWDRLGGRLAAVGKLAMSARANGAGAAARAGGEALPWCHLIGSMHAS